MCRWRRATSANDLWQSRLCQACGLRNGLPNTVASGLALHYHRFGCVPMRMPCNGSLAPRSLWRDADAVSCTMIVRRAIFLFYFSSQTNTLFAAAAAAAAAVVVVDDSGSSARACHLRPGTGMRRLVDDIETAMTTATYSCTHGCCAWIEMNCTTWSTV